MRPLGSKQVGGARRGAGQKSIENGRVESRAKAIAAKEKQYINGATRDVLIRRLTNGKPGPVDNMFDGMDFFRERVNVMIDRAVRAEAEGKEREAQTYYDLAAGYWDKVIKTAEKIMPFALPKLASMEHTGSVQPTLNVGGINVILESAINRLAAGRGTLGAVLQNDAPATGGADLRLGLLEQTGAAPADNEPKPA